MEFEAVPKIRIALLSKPVILKPRIVLLSDWMSNPALEAPVVLSSTSRTALSPTAREMSSPRRRVRSARQKEQTR